jgi:hypothetical protein
MLDYPRYFAGGDAFAIRCFFWWGKFFSITLHLSGRYAEAYGMPVLHALLAENDLWHVSIGEDPWQHHFDNDNYARPSKELLARLHGRRFQKFARKIPLEQWDEAHDFFASAFKELIALLKKVKK